MPPPTHVCIKGYDWLFLGGDDWVCSGGNHSWHGREDENEHLERDVRKLRNCLLHTSARQARQLTDEFHAVRDEWRRRRFSAVRRYEDRMSGGRMPLWIEDEIDYREHMAIKREDYDVAAIHNIISREEYFDQFRQQNDYSYERQMRKRAEEGKAYRLARQAELRLRDEQDQERKEYEERRRRMQGQTLKSQKEHDKSEISRSQRTGRFENDNYRQQDEPFPCCEEDQENRDRQQREKEDIAAVVDRQEWDRQRRRQGQRENEAIRQQAAERQLNFAQTNKQKEKENQGTAQMQEERAIKDEATIKSKFTSVRPDALVRTAPSSYTLHHNTFDSTQQQIDYDFEIERAEALRRIRTVHNSSPSKPTSTSTASSYTTKASSSHTTLAIRPALPSAKDFERERAEALVRINAVHSAPLALPAPQQIKLPASTPEMPWTRNSPQEVFVERTQKRSRQREKMPWEN